MENKTDGKKITLPEKNVLIKVRAAHWVILAQKGVLKHVQSNVQCAPAMETLGKIRDEAKYVLVFKFVLLEEKRSLTLAIPSIAPNFLCNKIWIQSTPNVAGKDGRTSPETSDGGVQAIDVKSSRR